MIRIVRKPNDLDENGEMVFGLLAIAIVDRPETLEALLKRHGAKVRANCPECLIDTTITMMSQGNTGFNQDLSRLLGGQLDPDQAHDQYAGVVQGISGAIDSIFKFAGGASRRKEIRETGRNRTIQGILAHKMQRDDLAAKTASAQNRSRTIVTALLVTALLGGLLIISKMNRGTVPLTINK